MGILNTTPDSFSDAGLYLDCQHALAHALQMVEDGAAIIDIGGESTRPGSEPVPAKEQIARTVPVIKALANKINIPISIDTANVDVAKAALDAGASIINDITALADGQMAALAAKANVPVILMHMQGNPQTMQKEPVYKDVVAEVIEFLLARAQNAQCLGIPKEHIILDPGIGFGKTIEHNLAILRNLDKFVSTDYRILAGTSRKRFIGSLTGKTEPADRIFGTAATVAIAVEKGVSIVRVHDVKEMADVVKVANAMRA